MDLAFDVADEAFDADTDQARRLRALIDGLDEMSRALVLFYLEGFDHSEIADLLGTSPAMSPPASTASKPGCRARRRSKAMDLDDLKAEWAKRDQALLQSLRLQKALLRDMLVEKRLEKLRRHHLLNVIEFLFYLAFVIGFGAFLAANWGRWEFFIPALFLDIWTIAMGAITIAERARLLDVDFSAPVLEIQKRLAGLQAERARVFQWAFLTGQVLWWIPFVIVLFWGVLGVDLYRASPFMPLFIASNIAVGLALIPILWWTQRSLGPRLAKSSLARSALDSITGRDLAEARAIATRLERFEAEAA